MNSRIGIFFLCAFMAEKTAANGCPSQTTVSAFVVNRFIPCLPFLVLNCFEYLNFSCITCRLTYTCSNLICSSLTCQSGNIYRILYTLLKSQLAVLVWISLTISTIYLIHEKERFTTATVAISFVFSLQIIINKFLKYFTNSKARWNNVA